jgi:hypothetical protein
MLSHLSYLPVMVLDLLSRGVTIDSPEKFLSQSSPLGKDLKDKIKFALIPYFGLDYLT